MGRDDAPGQVEFVDDGDGEPDFEQPDILQTAQRRLPRWTPLALLALTLAAAVTVVLLRQGGGSTSTAATTPASTPALSVPTAVTVPAAPRPQVTDVGHPLLGGGDWELFGFGPGVVARVQPSLGRVSTTAVPSLQSSGPVSFVVGADRALVRPLDFVTGYEVPDGRSGRELGAPLASGPIFPGPDPLHIWRAVDSGNGVPLLVLTALDGSAAAAQSIRLPPGSSPVEALADGAGYVVVPTLDGYYDATPDGLRRITTGSLLAVGRTGWLVVECDDRHRCGLWQVDRADFARHRVPFAVTADSIEPRMRGALAPDGGTAAVFRPMADGAGFRLMLLDLRTGRDIVLPLPGGADPQDGAVAFSPDSRWLLALRGGGQLAVVDPRDGAIGDLGVELPSLQQLAVRPG